MSEAHTHLFFLGFRPGKCASCCPSSSSSVSSGKTVNIHVVGEIVVASGTNLSYVTAHDKQWQQDARSSGQQRSKEDTDNILVVTAALVTSSSISRTSPNKICEIGLHHSGAVPMFTLQPELLYCSRMHFFPFAPR